MEVTIPFGPANITVQAMSIAKQEQWDSEHIVNKGMAKIIFAGLGKELYP